MLNLRKSFRKTKINRLLIPEYDIRFNLKMRITNVDNSIVKELLNRTKWREIPYIQI